MSRSKARKVEAESSEQRVLQEKWPSRQHGGASSAACWEDSLPRRYESLHADKYDFQRRQRKVKVEELLSGLKAS